MAKTCTTIVVLSLVWLLLQGSASWAGSSNIFSFSGWEQDLNDALAKVQPWLDHYGYAAIFVSVLVEGVGLLAPGQTLLVAAALLAAHGGLKITWVLFWAFLASVGGPCLAYLLGRVGGRPLLARLKVNERHLQRLTNLFDKYGPGFILVARFVDGLRQLHGFVAGLARMSGGKFVGLAILGAALWTGIWGLGAYLLDRHIAALHIPWQRLQPWLLGFILLGCLAGLFYLRGSRQHSQ